VLGLTAVLGTGEVVSTGGRFVKATTGYDRTQLIVGSEGTLALVTEAVRARQGARRCDLRRARDRAGQDAVVAPVLGVDYGPNPTE
jgi:FAD/FMN-containing dehydrogenase